MLIAKIKSEILNPVVGFMFALALLYFVYGMYEFIAGADNEDAVSKGREHMLYGIIGMFIMVSAFGILKLICNTIRC